MLRPFIAGCLFTCAAAAASPAPAPAQAPAPAAVPRPAITLAPATLSAALQRDLGARYGEAEADVLRSLLADSFRRALEAGGYVVGESAPIAVEPQIESARPTHPTPKEMAVNPSLDFMASVSLGGARLVLLLRAGKDAAPRRLECEYYAPTLWQTSAAASAWADAALAFDRCGDELATELRRSAPTTR